MTHTVINMEDFRNLDVYDYSREIWSVCLDLAMRIASGTRMKKVYCWDGVNYKTLRPLTAVNQGFARVDTGWVTAVDYRYWCAPVPLALRLSCMWQFKDLIEQHTKDYVAKVDDEFADAVKWTFWLNYQGVRHLDYLVEP